MDVSVVWVTGGIGGAGLFDRESLDLTEEGWRDGERRVRGVGGGMGVLRGAARRRAYDRLQGLWGRGYMGLTRHAAL